MNKRLQRLLDEASIAPRATRIDLRDPIAKFGDEAVAAIAPWLSDSELGAFAVRVVQRAAAEGARQAAIDALVAARKDASGPVRGDIESALRDLGYRATPTGPAAPAPVRVHEDLYDRLVAAARARETITYTDAGEILGFTMRNPHHRRLLGQHLGAISAREAEQGRPMLSAVVVQKGEKRTGTGFAQLGEELGIKRALDDDRNFDAKELDRVFGFWSKWPATRLSSGAPDYRTRSEGEEPPEAIGPCGFATHTGQCLNPGRWDRDGTLSCTTHTRARLVQPYRPQ